MQAEQERLDRIDQEAKALGDIAVDESWLMEMEEIKAKISAGNSFIIFIRWRSCFALNFSQNAQFG